MYKKSYKGLVLWMIGFLAVMFGICFVPTEDEQVMMRLVMLLMAWSITGLMFIIWRTEQIYWINGITYEAAEAAGSEKRKEFAWRHLRIFWNFTLLQSLISCGMHLLGWSAWIDFAFGTVGMVIACLMTIPIKLE